jgi:hypothetical protein
LVGPGCAPAADGADAAAPYRPCTGRGLGRAAPPAYLAPAMVTRFLHTRYRVNDLERSVRFYKEILGLQEERRHKSPRGSELVFLKAPSSEATLELCYYPRFRS